MHSIQLKVHDSLYDQFLLFVGKFDKSKLQIISDLDDASETRAYLTQELHDMDKGGARFLSQDEFEQRLDSVV